MSAVGDARKRQAEQHHTHPDPAVRELIAAAEARGAERVAQAVERLAGEMSAAAYLTLTSLLAEHRAEATR